MKVFMSSSKLEYKYTPYVNIGSNDYHVKPFYVKILELESAILGVPL